MQRSAAALGVGQGGGAAVVQQHQVELDGPSPGCTPVHAGVGVHPLAGGGARQQLEEHLQVAPGRDQLLDPHDGDQHPGRVRLRGRCPRTRPRPGCRSSATAKLASDTATSASRTCAAGAAGPPRPGSRSSVRSAPAGRPRPSRAGRSRGSRPGLRWIAGTRMWLGLSWPSWTISSARSVSQAAIPAAARASLRPISWVAIDLTLTTRGPRPPRPGRRRSGWPRRRAQWTTRPGRSPAPPAGPGSRPGWPAPGP